MRNKKIIQRFIAFVIVGTSLLTSFSACKLNGDPSNVNNDEMRETAEFIVKDGKTDYKIVMDSNPSPDEEFAKRKAAYVKPEPNIKSGWLARYAKLVDSADKGAVMKS
jgi:hypothetical protein